MGTDLLGHNMAAMAGIAVLGLGLYMASEQLATAQASVAADHYETLADAAEGFVRSQWGPVVAALPRTLAPADLDAFAEGGRRLPRETIWGGTYRIHLLDGGAPGSVRIAVVQEGGSTPAGGGAVSRTVLRLGGIGARIQADGAGVTRMEGADVGRPGIVLAGVAAPQDGTPAASVWMSAETAVPVCLARTEIPGLPEANILRRDIDLGGNRIRGASEIQAARIVATTGIQAPAVRADRIDAPAMAVQQLTVNSCTGC
jgi:hypothetical protein